MIFRRADIEVGIQPPGVNAADGTSQFREYLPGVIVLNEKRVAGESLAILPHINPVNKVVDFAHRRLFVKPIPQHAGDQLAPVFVIPGEHVLRQLRQWLAVELQDQPVWHQVRIRPIQRKTFLEIELPLRIPVKDNLGEQAVDAHDGDLATHPHLMVAHLLDLFPRLEPVLFQPLLCVGQVFLEAFLRVGIVRQVDFASIHGAQIVQIGSIGQGVLSQREERIALRVGLTEGCRHTAARVGAAKIDAARRDGANNAVGQERRIFGGAVGDVIVGQFNLHHRLPVNGPGNFEGGIGSPLVLLVWQYEMLNLVGHGPPIFPAGGREEAPNFRRNPLAHRGGQFPHLLLLDPDKRLQPVKLLPAESRVLPGTAGGGGTAPAHRQGDRAHENSYPQGGGGPQPARTRGVHDRRHPPAQLGRARHGNAG